MAKSQVVFWSSSFLFLGLSFASFGLSYFWIILVWIVFLWWQWHSAQFQNVVFIFLILGVLGFFYFHAFAVFTERREVMPKMEFTAHLVSESVVSQKSQRFIVQLNPPYRGKISVITQPGGDFFFGEKLELRGHVENNFWPEENILLFPKIKKIAEPPDRSLRGMAIAIKNQWLGKLKMLLTTDEAALLGGLTLGARGDFDAAFKEAMKRSGTTHLVALSGYNISILILAVERTLRSRISRKFFLILCVSLIIFFVLMVGGEASIVRAAIMGFLVLIAKEVGRFYNFNVAVLSAALLMTMWNPSLPALDLGFQLSFLSLLGIVFLEPIIARWLAVDQKHPSRFSWRENLSTTCAAQLGVFPILVTDFGVFSLTGAIANVCILWIVPVVMALGFLFIFLGMIPGGLVILLQPIIQLILEYMIGIIHLAASFPLFPIPWNTWCTVFYFGVLVWLTYRYANHEKKN